MSPGSNTEPGGAPEQGKVNRHYLLLATGPDPEEEPRRIRKNMAISLSSLRRTTAIQPPRIVLYGVQGIGKTSLGAEFPEPVFIQIEDGTPGDVEIVSFGQLKTFDEVMEAFGSLYTDEHDFKTVVVDTLDALEPLVWAKTCQMNGWKNIEDAGYGKGYVAAEDVWREYQQAVNALRERGMMVVQIAHCETVRYDPPGMEPYNRYHIKLHKRASALISQDADIVAFANYDVQIKKTDVGFNKKTSHAEGGGVRMLHFEERPAFLAKNRYGLPARLTYRRGQGYAEMAPYLPGGQPTMAEAAE